LERSVVVAESDIGVSYYQIGVIRPVPVNQKVDFFGNFTMGMTQYNFKNDIYNDQYFFSIVLGLGTKIWLNDVVGLRLQARLLAPINWAGLSFYCGTGGCGTGASASSTLISGDVGAGLILRLKK
jgi:hypothetical protein